MHRKYIVFYRDANEFDNWVIAAEFDNLETALFYMGNYYNGFPYMLVEYTATNNQVINTP